MADTPFRVPEVELVARASVPAAEYAEYKLMRHRLPTSALGQLDPAIRASTVVALDGLPFPVKFRNQGALDEWRRLFTAHDWSRRVWNDWASARATCRAGVGSRGAGEGAPLSRRGPNAPTTSAQPAPTKNGAWGARPIRNAPPPLQLAVVMAVLMLRAPPQYRSQRCLSSR